MKKFLAVVMALTFLISGNAFADENMVVALKGQVDALTFDKRRLV